MFTNVQCIVVSTYTFNCRLQVFVYYILVTKEDVPLLAVSQEIILFMSFPFREFVTQLLVANFNSGKFFQWAPQYGEVSQLV